MTTFTFTSPNGENYTVEGPDGATEQEAFQILQQQIGTTQPDTTQEAPQQPQEPTTPSQPTPEPGFLDKLTTTLREPLTFDRGGRINDLRDMRANNTATPAQLQALSQYENEMIAPNLAEAQKLKQSDPAQFGNLTDEQAAIKVATRKDLGDAVETGVGLATLPVGGAVAGIGKQMAIGAGLAGAGTAANQVTQSAVDGNDHFDVGDVAKSAATAGALTGVLGGAAKGVGKILAPTKSAVPVSNKVADVAEHIDDGDVKALQSLKQYNEAVPEADRINLAPSQIFRADTPEARQLAQTEKSVNDSLQQEGKVNRSMANQAKNADILAESSRREFTDSLSDKPESVLGGLVGKVRDSEKAKAGALYKENMDAADNALKQAKAIRPEGVDLTPTTAIKTAREALKENERLGNVTLGSHARTLREFTKAAPQDFKELDQWKRTLNERASKAFKNGDYEAGNAIKNVSNSLKADASKHANDLGANVGDFYKKADDNYRIFSGDFGKGTLGAKLADPKYSSDVVDRLLHAKHGVEDIKEMQRVVAKSPDAADAMHLQNAVVGSVFDRGIAKATGARTGAFNYGALAKELRNKMPHIEAALESNPKALERVKTLTDVFDTLRESDFARGTLQKNQSVLSGLMGNTSKVTPAAMGAALGGVLGGPVGTAAGAAAGHVAGEAGKKFLQNSADNALSNLADWAVKNADDIAAFKAAHGKKGQKVLAQAIARRLATTLTSGAYANGDAVRGDADSYRTLDRVKGDLNKKAEVQPQPVQAPVAAPQPVQAPVEPTAPVVEESPAEPVSEAPKATKPTKQATRLGNAIYKGITHAETGSEVNPWIRTKAMDKGQDLHSSAYGPAQLTYSLAGDYLNKNPEMFTKAEQRYLQMFVEQGKLMIAQSKGKIDDPKLAYGGEGYLTSKRDKELYESVVKKMMVDTYDRADGNASRMVTLWRGKKDPAYERKVFSALA